MAHPLRGVRCRVSRGRGNLRVQVHGRRSPLRGVRSSNRPVVAGCPRSSKDRRVRCPAAGGRRPSRDGDFRPRGRGSRCARARVLSPSSSVHRRCSPAGLPIAHREAPPDGAPPLPTPHAGCRPVRRTARSKRQSGSPRRGQLPLLPVPLVARPPRVGRRRRLPRADPAMEPEATVGSGACRGARSGVSATW